MKISMVWTASTQEAQTPQSTPSVITYSAGFNSIDQAPLETSNTQKNTDFYPSFSPQHWASCLDSTFIYTFHVPSHFYYVSHSTPTSFLFGFLFLFYYWVRAPTFQYFQLMQVAGM